MKSTKSTFHMTEVMASKTVKLINRKVTINADLAASHCIVQETIVLVPAGATAASTNESEGLINNLNN
jgi:hypothetical protein